MNFLLSHMQAVSRNDTVNCSNQFTSVRISGTDQKCISEVYTGEACRQMLARTQGCALGRNIMDVVSISSGSQQIISNNLTTFLSIIGKYRHTFTVQLSLYI